MPETRPYIPRIVLIFDFDRTLGTDSIDAVLAHYEIDRETWEHDFAEPLGQGWDEIIRRGQALIDLGRARGDPLTRTMLRDAAARVDLYPGVTDLPRRLDAVAREVHEGARVALIVLSSGYAEIIDATGIGDVFERIYASTFQFDAEGQAVCIKRIVDHPGKALYLEAIAKGVDIDGSNAPVSPGRTMDEHDFHVPFDQMAYLGDGASDLQSFAFMKSRGGLAIAVAKPGVISDAGQTRGQRVDNLAPPDYSEGGELLESLRHVVRACASRVALRALGMDE